MSTPEPNPAQKPTSPLSEGFPDPDDILAGGSGTVILEPSRNIRPMKRVDPLGHGRQSPEVEAALRQAGLLRARGDLAGAEREARQAIAMDSASSAAYEALGDLQMQAGQSLAAAESYRRAQSCGAGVAIESKIARATLQSSKADADMLREIPLTRGRPVLGYIASALVPGLGIALAGEYVPAAISFVGWAGTLGLMLAIPSVRAIVESSMGGGHSLSVGASAGSGGQFLALLLGVANIGFWIYSLVVTGRLARAGSSGGGKQT